MSNAELLRALSSKYYGDAQYLLKPDHYLDIYATYFEPIRHQPLDILELGIYAGASLLIWREYFPNARIVGLDISPAPECLATHQAEGTIACIQGDQSDTSVLQQCLDLTAAGQFDIVIDDAAHVGVLAKASFDFLFAGGLKSGGLYFVEDFGTSYMTGFADGGPFKLRPEIEEEKVFPSHNYGMVGWLKQVLDEITIRKYLDPDKVTRPIAACHFWPNLALVEKI